MANERKTGLSELGKAPEVKLLGTFPITGRENLELKGHDGRRVAQMTKFTFQGSLENAMNGQPVVKEHACVVQGNVGHYETGGVVDVFEAVEDLGTGAKNKAMTAVVRKPTGAFLQPAIFTNTAETESW